MTLKELKKMIAEEYAAFNRFNEQQAPGGDMPPLPGMGEVPDGEPAVSVSDKDIDATGGAEDAEKTLKKMFDMLKDYFEGDDDKPTPAPKKDDEGDDKGDDKGGDKDDDKKSKAKEKIQEHFFKSRLKKLANING